MGCVFPAQEPLNSFLIPSRGKEETRSPNGNAGTLLSPSCKPFFFEGNWLLAARLRIFGQTGVHHLEMGEARTLVPLLPEKYPQIR